MQFGRWAIWADLGWAIWADFGLTQRSSSCAAAALL
jgi:hypothetical protein